MGYPVLQYQPTHAQPLLFLLIDTADHRTGLTGATPTVVISKNGGAFATPQGAVTEIGNGWYAVAANYYDADTLGVLALHATATGADPCDDDYDVVTVDQYVGLTHEQYDIATPILVLLIAASDHITGLTGATPAGTISQNGDAFAAVGGTFTEVGQGWYRFTPATADVTTLGPAILHVTAASADPTDFTFDIIPAASDTVSTLLASDLFDMMAVLDNEMQLGTGETDQARALTALNMALRQLDLLASTIPPVLATELDFGMTASRDWTVRPASLLRLDALWRLDLTTGDPIAELTDIQRAGGHRVQSPYGLLVSNVSGSAGAPGWFTLDKTRFHWLPVPDAAYSVRAYGYVRTPRLTSRVSSWYHGDETALAVATLAVRYLSMGVGDETTDLQQAAQQVLIPLLRGLKKASRTGPQGRVYTQFHTT